MSSILICILVSFRPSISSKTTSPFNENMCNSHISTLYTRKVQKRQTFNSPDLFVAKSSLPSPRLCTKSQPVVHPNEHRVVDIASCCTIQNMPMPGKKMWFKRRYQESTRSANCVSKISCWKICQLCWSSSNHRKNSCNIPATS